MKICSRCGNPKPLEKFYKRASAKDGHQAYCKECAKGHYKAWSEQTPERRTRQEEWKRQRVAENRELYVETLRKSDGCDVCGYKDNIAALVFDHRPGFTKVGGVLQMVNAGSPWTKICEEIVKCDLLCWNCHAIVTATRGGWWTTTVEL